MSSVTEKYYFERDLETIFDKVSDGILIVSLDAKILRINKALLDLGGYRQEELVGKNVLKLSKILTAQSLKKIAKSFLDAAKGVPNDLYQIQAKDRDGKIHDLEISNTLIRQNNKSLGVVVMFRDVTSRNIMANKIEEADQFLNNIINTVSDPIFVKDNQHRWIVLNDAFCKFIGQSREKLIGKSDYDFFPKKEADIFWQKDEEVFQKGKENINEENFTDAKGVTHIISTKKNIYFNNQKEKFLVGIIRDITTNKMVEQAVNESEEKFRNLFESSLDSIVILEPPAWKFIAGNPMAIKMFAVKSEKEFTALGPWNVSPKNQPDGQLSERKSKMMIEKAMKEGSNSFEWVHKKLNGEEFLAVVLLSKIKIKGKDLLQATIRDITQQRQVEEKLKERAKELAKMNKLMVGRELKMIELKEKLEKLAK
ncbi:MAG: PAS domain S-box protein [Patescibacteria group bacterium]